MNNLKRLVALVLVAVMSLALCGTALASSVAGARTLDSSISVTGLTVGDTVTLYKVLKWDDNDYWSAADGFTTALNQTAVDTLIGQNHTTGAITTPNLASYVDAIIGAALNANPVTGHEADVLTETTYTVSGLEAGLYYVLVAPKDATTLYNPMIVAVDYDSSNSTNTVSAKKQTITFDKTATGQTTNIDASATYTSPANTFNTVGIGDTVDFQIETLMPAFPASFSNPVYKISDTLDGLTLKHATGEIKVYNTAVDAANLAAAGTDYTESATDTGFTLTFSSNYIAANGGKKIYVVYQGIVNDVATYDVNVKANTAKVNFSNNPNDNVGANELEDKTKHYTFSIDALVTSERHGTDLIKVGVDKDGKEITAVVQLPNSNWAGVLQGAKFALFTDEACTTPYKTTYANLASDGQGMIQITGLDAGTYWLKETDAPDGYIKAQKPVKVEIIPVFKETTVDAQTKNVIIGTSTVQVTVPAYKYAELESFTIKIDNVLTSSYTWVNEAISGIDDDQIGAGSSSTDPGTSTTGKIMNTKGVELPSTGGIGTTIFYAIGAVLVLGAASIIIARRKAEQN